MLYKYIYTQRINIFTANRMHSTLKATGFPIYETMAEVTFSSAAITVDEAAIRRVAASLNRLAGVVGQPAAPAFIGETDFLAALEKAGA